MSKKILIVGPAWVGDMVMAQSLFKLLKSVHADVILHVLAPAWTFSLLNAMPEISKAIPLPFKHGELQLRARLKFARHLRAEKYDEAIVLPNSFKSALIPWFAKIPKRTGWFGECRFILNDRRHLDEKKYPLMIEQFMALGLPPKAALPAVYPYPSFTIAAHAQKEILQKYKLNVTKPILALCPGGAFGPAKRWPPEYFAELACAKLNDNYDVWIFGSKDEITITEKIQHATNDRAINIPGEASLAEIILLLSCAQEVVTNDTGLMHIAAALQKKIVAIYGPTSPHFTPPLTLDAKILQLQLDCQPCFARACPLTHHRCMQDLKPEMVLQALNAEKN